MKIINKHKKRENRKNIGEEYRTRLNKGNHVCNVLI